MGRSFDAIRSFSLANRAVLQNLALVNCIKHISPKLGLNVDSFATHQANDAAGGRLLVLASLSTVHDTSACHCRSLFLDPLSPLPGMSKASASKILPASTFQCHSFQSASSASWLVPEQHRVQFAVSQLWSVTAWPYLLIKSLIIFPLSRIPWGILSASAANYNAFFLQSSDL
jgi:hypothetical protein